MHMPNAWAVALALPLIFSHVASTCAAGFFDDSKVSLTARNYYLDRDFKGPTPWPAAREWAQGFILKAQSGFSEGTVGFGLDATALLGLKLDSSPDRTGTQLLAYNPSTREARDEYSELGLTFKARVAHSLLRVGTLMPGLPVLTASPARLLPQWFRGVYATSQDIEGLTLHLGHVDGVNLRDSTDVQPLSLAAPNGRFLTNESEQFDFLGAEYKLTEALELRYFHARLRDVYRQDFYGLNHQFPLGPGVLKTDLRIFDSREDGQAMAGQVDNANYGAYLSYKLAAHTFSAGYMVQNGATAMPYIAGGEPSVLSDGAMSADFVNPKERTWVARYDFDFAPLGVPGLTAMLRYMRGTHIELPRLGGSDLTESSKDLELAYVVQTGPLRGLAFRAREAFYRSDLLPAATFRSDNETRINIDYTWVIR